MSRAGVSLPGCRHVCQTQQKSTSRLHDNRGSPVSRDPGIAVPGSRLAGLTFFHVIAFAGPARLIKPIRAQNQARSGFPRFIASAINRAGSPHIIPAESDLGTPKQPGYPGQPGSCNQALKEIENMFFVFLSSYRNTRESLGELEKALYNNPSYSRILIGSRL